MTDIVGVAEAIGQTAATDPEIKARVKDLAMMVLDEVEEALETGAPMTKSQLVRSFLPYLIRSMQDKKESEELAELRADMERLRNEIREATYPEGEIIRVTVGEDRPVG